MKDFFRLIKIKHWTKNIFFIYAPLIFSLNLFDIKKLFYSTLTVISFSFVSVLVYIINDIKDKENDKIHPEKSKRPIASGRISIILALIIGIIFFIVGLFISFLVGIKITLIVLLYLIINLLYTFFIKNIIIVDVFFIAIGFCLRVLIGAVAINVELSNWMIFSTFFISLFLGFGKRRNEIVLLGDEALNHRSNYREYKKEIIDFFIIITASITAIGYSLYTMDMKVMEKLHTNNLLYTVPFVLYGLFRYLYLIYGKNKGGNPEDIVLKDPGIIITVLLWAFFVIFFIYFRNINIFNELNFSFFTIFKK
ncbi:MAG TPA: decaprenyl-phosphate phosphoribosyltransferase [Spirochaetota bacterium]|mgnify:CR=1 FL=1|nr:decaprenyl-phosphate phosphoribosyltransferase [Spirochaetota bacterium]HOL56343.1 decaprenyl-phosphate phosphoribosyltransferase [Spirochaetota bacterium]HPP03540.1 decaprenyl-phosphate phosphoribosyltransferase [Spirochaetota bacterium]